MEITTGNIGAIKVVRIPKQMDDTTARKVKELVQHLLADGQSKILCDLAATETVSESGLKIFIETVSQVHAANGQIAFCKLTPAVKEIFVNAGLTHIYKYYDFGEALQLSILKELSADFTAYSDIHEIRLQRLEDCLRIDLFLEFEGSQQMFIVQENINNIKRKLEDKIKGSEVCIIPTTAAIPKKPV